MPAELCVKALLCQLLYVSCVVAPRECEVLCKQRLIALPLGICAIPYQDQKKV